MSPDVYIGIDLAAGDKKTAVCRLTWPDTLEIHVGGDSAAASALSDPAVTASAVDAPFGWPTAFVKAISARGARLDGKATSAPYHGLYTEPAVREALCYRHTDRFVRFAAKRVALDAEVDTGRWPTGLSVSANMIGATALRAIGLLDAVDPDLALGVDFSPENRITEAYPGTTLSAWGMGTRPNEASYKGRKPENKRARERLIAQLVSRIRPVNEPFAQAIDQNATLAGSDDALDALVCVIVARAWAEGLTWSVDNDGPHGRTEVLRLLQDHPQSPPVTESLAAPALSDVAAIEGWIAHPYATLEEVVAP